MFLALEFRNQNTLQKSNSSSQIRVVFFFFLLKTCLLVKFHIKPELQTSLFTSEMQMLAMELQIILTKD